MDVSGPATSTTSQTASQIASHTLAIRTSSPLETLRNEHDSADSGHSRRSRGRSGHAHALAIFKHDVQTALKAHFRARFPVSQANYTALQDAPDSSAIAAETIGAAKQVVSETPTGTDNSLNVLRARIEESASYVRSIVDNRDGTAAVNDVVAQIDDGLDALESELAANREATSSVLAVDTRSRQRSTIQIRTREGDVVKLALRQFESTSATATAVSDGDEFSSLTEIEISSRSRLSLRVKGDLNKNELEAIQNVFEQAANIADEFFGGNLAAAFDLAAGSEFDTEQLARVKLQFRSYQSSAVSYSESVSAPPQPAATAAPVNSDPEIVEQPDTVIDPADEVPAPATVEAAAFGEFFALLSDFLRSVGAGFDSGEQGGATAIRLHYSESFKLELLKAVVHSAAPDEAVNSAANAAAAIDGISATDEQIELTA